MFGKFADAFRLIDDAALVAVASRDIERARAAGVKHGVPRAHASYATLVDDPNVDIVINALHNGLHCEWTLRALDAGKHVLCEKPLACSVAEVERMFAAAHAKQRWLMEGFMYRFHPQMTEAEQIVNTGVIGRVLHIRCNRTAQGRDRDNPRYRREAGGGALMDVGCYCVNLARHFAGGEPKRVDAGAHFDEETGVDLTLCGCLHFDGDITAQFVCSMETEPSYPAEIIGTKGKLLIPHPWAPQTWPAELYLTREGNTEIVRVEAPQSPRHVLASYALELNHFCQCVRENRAPQFPPHTDAERDSRANMRALEALAESARKTRAVDVMA
jgi:D-xylose 1-dehydrogenase (NADP+, D-xylono-1,5-lactone-forming)